MIVVADLSVLSVATVFFERLLIDPSNTTVEDLIIIA